LNLSYLEGVEKELTGPTKQLLPPPRIPVSPYFEDGKDEAGKAQSMLTYIKTKPTNEDLLSWFKEKYFSGNDMDKNALDIVINVALHAGMPSYTHSSKALERVSVLLKFIKKEGEQRGVDIDNSILKSIAKFWSSSPSRVTFISKELLSMGLVSYSAVLDHFVDKIGSTNTKKATKFEWVEFDFLSEWLVQLETERETKKAVQEQIKATTELDTPVENKESDVNGEEARVDKNDDSNGSNDEDKEEAKSDKGDDVVKCFHEKLKKSAESSENPLYAASLLRKHSRLFQ